MVSVNDRVKVHGKLMGVVTSVHGSVSKVKKVGVKFDCGKSTFTSVSNVKVVTA